MPPFYYEAIDASGRISSGRFNAEMISDVESWLGHNGLTPVNIEAVSENDGLGQFPAAGDRTPTTIEKLRGVTLDDRILMCRQISTMLRAGVAILQSLDIMAKQVNNTVLRNILAEAGLSIEGGSSLSDSFANYPKVFDQLFLNVIQVGEESGTLDRSFNYLAALYENEKDVHERIKAATRYPKIVITAIFIAVFILMSFVVPKFASLFANAKVALPLPTRILISVSGFFAEYYLAIAIFIVAVIIMYRVSLNYEKVRLIRDRLLLRTPVFGDLSIKIYMSRFCRVFAVLTESGINIIKTLQLAGSALNNLVLFKSLEKVRADVSEGMDIHSAMDKFKVFPPMVVQMIAVGEESGQLDEMMGKVADYFDDETNYTIKNLATLIEPFLLLFLGIMVAFIALSIFLPMWNIMSVMRG
ncbi:MAG: type II secretion system F family protein [Proteobacteria bacterium]|nr:type II secretion system F family protein [Pseudomonadota bacterium]MBU1739839.1 type II secretion system F family protein [Pseudomonadota bacterium]